ncbi:hypothetical protein [Streptomyces sp. H27-H5]|uniref:hypothetical protein n=1 Tax=Streptomyces sp. H27-H5 TaxID=2996460 RepID=UPI00226D4A49|nr:hypothetical protein [Streptomyces sp. H27-H5]MCY0957743.1 hypothetical protein [Streptomyces sp. H27-H5]
MSSSSEKQIVRDWQTPEGFQSSNDGSSCGAVRTYADGSVDLKSTIDPAGNVVPLNAGEWAAFKAAIKAGQYDF